MLLGALIDAGASVPAIRDVLDRLVPGAITLEAETVSRCGQRARKANVLMAADKSNERTWASIKDLLTSADIPNQTRDWSIAVFSRLAAAEARVHGVQPGDVHFHEVGALDSIADVVGACEGLRLLGVSSVSASSVALGSGRIRAAHGDIPVPAPAVAELTIGWPSSAGPADQAITETPPMPHSHEHVHYEGPTPVTTPGEPGELATPTGLAFIRALAKKCESFPNFTATAIGIGAGGKDFSTHANVVRVVIGDSAEGRSDHVVELAANIDDLEPRLWPGVIDSLLQAGALDAWLSPAFMKKGRPAYTLYALTHPDDAQKVSEAILTSTTTLGVRASVKTRMILDRCWQDVTVAGETVTVKIGSRNGVIVHAMAEFDSLAQAAERAGLGVTDAAQRANAAIVAAGLTPGAKLNPDLARKL